MVKSNILKIDNWLIKIGITVILISALLAIIELADSTHYKIYPGKSKMSSTTPVDYHSAESIDQVKLLYPNQYIEDMGLTKKSPLSIGIAIFVAIAGLGLFISGFRYRTWEKKIVQLWKILHHTREISLTDLQSSSNYDIKSIQKALPIINTHADAFYVLDLKEQKIIDGRLRTEYALNEKCPNCGNAITQTINLANMSDIACAYCNTALPAEFFNNAKSKILNELYEKTDTQVKSSTEKKKINIGVLILLVMVFWPAAIVYVYRRSNLSQTLE